jgi:hypothetical protein
MGQGAEKLAMSELPQDEVERLLLTLWDAHERAMQGDVAGGRLILATGLEQARAAERTEAAPWQPVLTDLWEAALSRFSAAYGATDA